MLSRRLPSLLSNRSLCVRLHSGGPSNASVDPLEVAKFQQYAQSWWDPSGPFSMLHRFNPYRVRYFREAISQNFNIPASTFKPFEGLKILDIGCGGGILSEPLARLGASVTGIDAGEAAIATAHQRLYSQSEELKKSIEYRLASVEELAEEGTQYDAVIASEVIEHVVDIRSFTKAATSLVKPGGVFAVSTFNRTPTSFLLGVVAAEKILRIVPQNSHDWRRFVRPEEIDHLLVQNGLESKGVMGIHYNPLTGSFYFDPLDMSVNYVAWASKPASN